MSSPVSTNLVLMSLRFALCPPPAQRAASGFGLTVLEELTPCCLGGEGSPRAPLGLDCRSGSLRGAMTGQQWHRASGRRIVGCHQPRGVRPRGGLLPGPGSALGGRDLLPAPTARGPGRRPHRSRSDTGLVLGVLGRVWAISSSKHVLPQGCESRFQTPPSPLTGTPGLPGSRRRWETGPEGHSALQALPAPPRLGPRCTWWPRGLWVLRSLSPLAGMCHLSDIIVTATL